MTRQNAAIADDDDDAFDERGVMKDGKRWHVPMRMMDSFQRDVAKHFGDLPKARDADGAPLGQPGFTRAATVRDTRNALYDQYDAAIANQWKNWVVSIAAHRNGPQCQPGPSVAQEQEREGLLLCHLGCWSLLCSPILALSALRASLDIYLLALATMPVSNIKV